MGTRETDRQLRQVFWAGLAFLVFTELLALTGIAPAPHRFLTFDPNSHSPFFAYAVAGVFAMHAVIYRWCAHVVAALAIGLVLTALHEAVFFDMHQHWLLVLSTFCYYLGIGSGLLLLWQGWRHRGSEAGRAFIDIFQVAALLPLFVNISWFYLEASSVLRPVTFDTTLYHFDGSLGFQASAWVGRLFEQSIFFTLAGHFFYVALPMFAALLYGMQRDHAAVPANVLKVFLVVAVAGYAIYFVYPAAGPLFLFGDLFPDRMPGLDAVPLGPALLPPAYRNAMPSLHMAWALVLWFNARNLSRAVRIGFALMVWGTVLAALGRGEHYLVDLVVAFPLALTAQAVCTSGMPKQARCATGIGVAMLACWLAYLSFGAPLFEDVGFLHAIPIAVTVLATLRLAGILAQRRQISMATCDSLPRDP